jgi:hypothetical protein
MLVCATEMRSEEEIEAYGAALESIVGVNRPAAEIA